MARATGSARARVGRRASRLASRLAARRTALGLVVIAIGAFLAYVAFISTTGPPFQSRYEIEVRVPDDAPVLREGQAVRVGGRLAGLISAVDPDRDGGGATVRANITKASFRPLPADTRANVRVHSIVYETYLELWPGTADDDLEHGDSLASAATSGVDLLEAVELFDEEARSSLRETTVNVGVGLAGRGLEANRALGDVGPLSRDLRSQLRAVTREEGALADLVAGASGTARGLRGFRDDDVAATIGSADATLAVLAERRKDLGAAIRLLRPFEDELARTAPVAEPLLDDVAALSADLLPAVRSLNATLPSLDRLAAGGERLRTETARIADLADPVLDAARPVVFDLFPTMTSLGPLNADLAELKATVAPYAPEIRTAGLRLADATSHRYPQGLAGGAPALRVLPVLGPRHCRNPIPAPGEAEEDSC